MVRPAPHRGRLRLAALAIIALAGALTLTLTLSSRRLDPLPSTQARLTGLTTLQARQVEQAAAPLARDCIEGALAIVVNGKVAYTNGWGRKRAITHRYQWGSVSKVVTALIAMRLAEDGKLNLDQPIWEIASRYEVLMPAARRTTPLTTRHLLTHTGGVTRQKFRDSAKMFLKSRGKYRYSSNGYGVIGGVLRAASGQTYPGLVTTFINDRLVGTRITAARDSFIAPAAWVVSNISDLGSFAVGVLDHRFVSPETAQEMATRHVKMPSSEGDDSAFARAFAYGVGSRPDAYGYGLEIAGPVHAPIIAHSGKNGAKRAFLYLRTEQRSGVVGFCTSRTKNGPVPWWSVTDAVLAGLD